MKSKRNTELLVRGFSFRIYPTKHQARILARLGGIAKVTYATFECLNSRIQQACQEYAEKKKSKKKIKLHIRTFVCDTCGVSLDRDINAANNLVLFAMNRWHKDSDGHWCSDGSKGAHLLTAGDKDRHSDESGILTRSQNNKSIQATKSVFGNSC